MCIALSSASRLLVCGADLVVRAAQVKSWRPRPFTPQSPGGQAFRGEVQLCAALAETLAGKLNLSGHEERRVHRRYSSEKGEA